MVNLLAIVWTTGAALGSFMGGNTRAFQAHTSLDKAVDCFAAARLRIMIWNAFSGAGTILTRLRFFAQAGAAQF